MQFLKADTAVKVVIGPVVAVGDGFTPVTTLSLSTADEAEIMKHDASAVTDISSNTFAAITSADGYYNLTITAAQLDTEGMLTVLINDDSLCLPVRHDFMVVNANVYDSFYAAATTDYLQVDTIQVGGTTQTAGDIPALVTTVDTVVDGIQTDLDNGTDGLGALKTLIDTVDTVVDAIKVVTDAQAATGTGLTAIPWNAAWDAEVQSEVNDGLVAFFTSAANLVDLIWDEVITGAAHNVATSAAKYLREAAQSSAMLTGTAQSGTASTIVLASGAVTVDDILNGERVSILDGTGAGQSRLISDSTASSDTVTVSHDWTTNPDSTSIYAITGAEVDVRAVAEQAVSATATVDFDDLATILTDTADMQPKLGTPAGADMSADIASIQTDTTAIVADTNELQTDWANGGRLDLIVDELTTQGDTNETKLDTLTTNVATVDTVVDSILVDTASMGITKNATFSNLEFLMVDATDHITPETGLTVTGQMSIDGAAFTSINGTIAEISNGIYQVDLTAADTNGDVITYRFSATGAADRFITIKTRA